MYRDSVLFIFVNRSRRFEKVEKKNIKITWFFVIFKSVLLWAEQSAWKRSEKVFHVCVYLWHRKCFLSYRDSRVVNWEFTRFCFLMRFMATTLLSTRFWYMQERIQMSGELTTRDGNWNGFYCNSASLCRAYIGLLF